MKNRKVNFDYEKSYLDGGAISVLNRDKMQNSIDITFSSKNDSFLNKNDIFKKKNTLKKSILDEYNRKIYTNQVDHNQKNVEILPPIYTPKPKNLDTS